MQYAPIIVFVYKRLDHVKAVVNALQSNPESRFSDLIVYSDAARSLEDELGVNAVREYVQNLSGFSNVRVIMRTENYGIERNEVEGITETLEQYESAIILEDDIVVGPFFLSFMNTALEKYKDEKRVYSITGYSFIKEANADNDNNACVFIQLTSAWGWGTWKSRWQHFSNSITSKELLRLCTPTYREKFNHGYTYADMVINQYREGYLTWDILWYWSVFKNGGLTLAPVRTMVNNIGMDGSGVHYTNKQSKNRIEHLDHEVTAYPDTVEENLTIRFRIEEELKQLVGTKSKNRLVVHYNKWKSTLKWILIYFWIVGKMVLSIVNERQGEGK